MRVAVQNGWVVGFQEGKHRLDSGHEVVYDDDRIVYVGPRFEGHVDERIDAAGMLVTPGFIDTHVHSGHRASHRLITDSGRPDYFGQPFLEISVPKEGSLVQGDPRYVRPDKKGADLDLALNARFTVAELLRNGTTTFVEYGAQLRVQKALAEQCSLLGVRGYLGAGFDSGRWVGDQHGRLKRIPDDSGGQREFENAVAWLDAVHDLHGDLVRPILVARELENCTLDLLRLMRRAADERGWPMATHAAYSVLEFYDIVREHRMTPIELMDSIGLLRPSMNIGHGNFTADNRKLNYSGSRDLKLMGAAGASISHCPINLIRRARSLDSWARYQDAGVNIALGTDTYPRDMISNMRAASYQGKLMSDSLFAASAADVFTAATVNGAKSLGRTDLGRLEPGACADILLIDMTGGGTLRWGPVRDPIKSLVECGVGDDVKTAIVGGQVRMRDGVIPGVDLAQLRTEAQAAGERVWASVPQWDPLGRSAEQMCPWSFCATNLPGRE